ncbi:transposase [Streptomyces sp. NBC_00083]|uniref:IS701 family transposase n=1 Tax=Streptomyces sp. NBC_00083 TaxID=2975647 RepID=UPI00224CDDB4|nr:transposase [Streptomyces sp. NBC_00083]MCX5386669.1 transposase [Streptomyces sp. NBC_00083]
MSSILQLAEEARGRQAPLAAGDFASYCQDLFGTLTRSDQRRWGEVYLRGLLDAPGRKTPTRISEHVLGRRAVQQLQQFLHQSPWDSAPVRRRIAERTNAVSPTEAWAVDEVVFAKNGDRTVGVARQYAPSRQRTVNCQLSYAISLVGTGGGVPVNWRLLLPQRWDRDDLLRRQAHVPAGERSRPRWRYVLEALDEMAEEWLLAPQPVLADWRSENDVESLLRGLEARGHGYVIEVSPSTVVTLPRSHATSPAARGTAAEFAEHLARRGERTAVAWYDRTADRMRRSQFLSAPALLYAGGGRRSALRHRPSGPAFPRPDSPEEQPRQAPRPRHLVTEWPYGRSTPRAHWLTNLPTRRLGETIALAQLRGASAEGLHRLRTDFGLGDFEGRSFRGWHHHVTLASAALAFDTLTARTEEGWLSGRRR